MSMLKRTRMLFPVVLLVLAIGLIVLNYRMRKNANILYGVSDVLSATSLKLSNGKIVELAGIEISEHQEEAKVRVRQLIGNHRVFITSSEGMKYDVFIWGASEGVLGRKSVGWDVVGAYNVYAGFLDMRKGTCIYLNEVLVNDGVAIRNDNGIQNEHTGQTNSDDHVIL